MGLAAFEVGSAVVASVLEPELDDAWTAELVELVVEKLAEGRTTFILDVGTELSDAAATALRRVVLLLAGRGSVRVWGLGPESERAAQALGLDRLELHDDWSSALVA
jgi:hypothetical protein